MIDRTLKHYRIIGALGSGGMGEVYLAEDTTLDRKVALKILPADVVSNRDPKTWTIGDEYASVVQRKGFGQEVVSKRIVLAIEFDDRLIEQGQRIGGVRE